VGCAVVVVEEGRTVLLYSQLAPFSEPQSSVVSSRLPQLEDTIF
jgi:hypothetical protein